MAGLFQGDAQAALVSGASACFPARLDFASIRDEALHKAAGVFVVNIIHMVVAELTNLAASTAFSAPASFAAGAIMSSLHERISL
jgi:hypothetical protein